MWTGTGMVVSGVFRSEIAVGAIEDQLKKLGLYGRYEGRVRGEDIVVTVRTMGYAEVELVKRILHEAGVAEILYEDESAA